MEKSIILLLFFSIVLAMTSFYLGFIKPSKNLGRMAKLFFVLVIIVLIPLFAGILWFQNTAKQRLMETGVVPYPGLGETIGIAFGAGTRPVWLFRTGTDTNIVSFYTNENNRPGWELQESGEQKVYLVNKSDLMTISLQKERDKGTIMYLIEKNPVNE